MNIAIIIPDLSGGGAERIATRISDNFYEHGNDVYVFLLKAGAICEYKTKAKVIRLNFDFNGYDESGEIKELRRASGILKKYKKEYSIDVSISFMEWANALNVFSKCRDKAILSVRTFLSARGYTSMHCQKAFVKKFYNRAFGIVAVSEAVREDLINNYLLDPRKVRVISNPAIKRNKKHIENWVYGSHVLACVGRFEPVKQQDRIIRAFSYVYENEKRARLLLIGKGYTEEYLKWICRKIQIDEAVVFIPFTENLGFYLENIRALVVASKAEGFPNVMVEAMASGVPAISTDSPGGCGEILGKKDSEPITDIQVCKYGILTPNICGKAPNFITLEEQELLLGKAMLKVIEDGELYNELVKKSLERAKDYDEATIMNAWNSLVEGG